MTTPYYDEDGITIYHGDCREIIEELQVGFDLLIADPPYGLSKESAGVANDNLHAAKLDLFQMQWWAPSLRVLRADCSAYVFGLAADLWRLWYVGGMAESDPKLSVASEIAWRKDTVAGLNSPSNRSFVESERALFILRGDQQFSINSSVYFEGYEPIRSYLEGEVKKLGWDAARVHEITGTVSMFPRWFSKSQWHLMTWKHYEALAAAADYAGFLRPYYEIRKVFEDVRAGHDAERRKFYQGRAYFDGTQSDSDIWSFPTVKGSERYGHPTAKPVDLTRRMILSSCPEGGTVLDPFMGCGPVPRAAKDLNRKCVAIELEERYCEAAVRRLAQLAFGFY